VTAPRFDTNVVSQALYTWSPANVDGSKGVGFAAVSPSLAGSADWLQRLQPAGFNLHLTSDQATLLELQDEEREFSELGRTFAGDVGIIYRKTANGSIDSNGRPHVLVHALMGRAEALTVFAIGIVRPFAWLEHVAAGEIPLQLADLTEADLCLERKDLLVGHDCQQDHKGARRLLQEIAEAPPTTRFERTFDSQTDALAAAGAFRPIAPAVTCDPYVTSNGTSFVLACSPRPLRPLAASARCTFEQGLLAAANAHLLFEQGDLPAYARAALYNPPVPRAVSFAGQSAGPSLAGTTGAPPATNSLAALVSEAGADAVLGEAASLRVAEEIRRGRISSLEIERSSNEVLGRIFGAVENIPAVVQWAQALNDVPVRFFLGSWNTTGLSALLGIALLRGISPQDLRDLTLASAVARDPTALANFLLMTTSLPDGARSLAICLSHGLGRSDVAREFIAATFKGNPGFLFDRVLPDARLSDGERLDFLRLLFPVWAEHRRIPPLETRALAKIWDRKLFARIRAFLTGEAVLPALGPVHRQSPTERDG
jgi:hypothetical protein